jgi:hypothetical protein
MRRVVLALCALAVALPAGDAAAGPITIATVTANVPISVQRGWAVWSARGPDGWHLVAWHNGLVGIVPGAPRAERFDVDLGTDSRNRTVATFSRCSKTPHVGGEGGSLDPSTGAGCRIHVQILSSGREKTLPIPHGPGQSDTTPSMWNRRVVFARRDPRRHKDVQQVLLWSPHTKRLRVLPHGAVPTRCPYRGGCKGQRVSGHVTGMDLGPKLAAFTWSVVAPAVIGHGGLEVRAVVLTSGRSRLVGSGFAGEACAGGVDAAVPTPPTVSAHHVWYAELVDRCYSYTSSAVRFNARAGSGTSAPLVVDGGPVMQFSKWGASYLALVAPTPPPDNGPSCSEPGKPCKIELLPRPQPMKAIRTPHSPFY